MSKKYNNYIIPSHYLCNMVTISPTIKNLSDVPNLTNTFGMGNDFLLRV